jgi:hypothetical protein
MKDGLKKIKIGILEQALRYSVLFQKSGGLEHRGVLRTKIEHFRAAATEFRAGREDKHASSEGTRLVNMSSPNRKPGLKLALANHAHGDANHQDESHLTIPHNTHVKDYAEESDIHPEISVDLKFSDSHTIHLRLKTGDTVQNIKKRLEAEHNMPYAKTALSLNGQQMLDPLSLNDFAPINEAVKQKRNVVIDVQVHNHFY